MNIDRKRFFDLIRASLFGGRMSARQVGGIEMILQGFVLRHPNGDIRWLAYMLATAFHETATAMVPVRETQRSDEIVPPTVETAIARLESSWRAGKMPWVKTAYWRKDAEGKSWLGRGLPQLTHRANYDKLGQAIGTDLVKDPELALVDEVAVAIMVVGMTRGLFTTRKLADYFGPRIDDAQEARRIINGVESAGKVAGYHRLFLAAIKAAFVVVVAKPIAAEPRRHPSPSAGPSSSFPRSPRSPPLRRAFSHASPTRWASRGPPHELE